MRKYLSRMGFTTKDLRHYIALCREDTKVAQAERVAMLRTHKRQAWQELEDLQATIDFLEREEEAIR